MADHSIHLIFVITDIFSRIFGEIRILVFVQESTVHGHQYVLDITDNLISELCVWNGIRLLRPSNLLKLGVEVLEPFFDQLPFLASHGALDSSTTHIGHIHQILDTRLPRLLIRVQLLLDELTKLHLGSIVKDGIQGWRSDLAQNVVVVVEQKQGGQCLLLVASGFELQCHCHLVQRIHKELLKQGCANSGFALLNARGVVHDLRRRHAVPTTITNQHQQWLHCISPDVESFKVVERLGANG